MQVVRIVNVNNPHLATMFFRQNLFNAGQIFSVWI
jgi:hypothetical protein